MFISSSSVTIPTSPPQCFVKLSFLQVSLSSKFSISQSLSFQVSIFLPFRVVVLFYDLLLRFSIHRTSPPLQVSLYTFFLLHVFRISLSPFLDLVLFFRVTLILLWSFSFQVSHPLSLSFVSVQVLAFSQSFSPFFYSGFALSIFSFSSGVPVLSSGSLSISFSRGSLFFSLRFFLTCSHPKLMCLFHVVFCLSKSLVPSIYFFHAPAPEICFSFWVSFSLVLPLFSDLSFLGPLFGVFPFQVISFHGLSSGFLFSSSLFVGFLSSDLPPLLSIFSLLFQVFLFSGLPHSFVIPLYFRIFLSLKSDSLFSHASLVSNFSSKVFFFRFPVFQFSLFRSSLLKWSLFRFCVLRFLLFRFSLIGFSFFRFPLFLFRFLPFKFFVLRFFFFRISHFPFSLHRSVLEVLFSDSLPFLAFQILSFQFFIF